MNKYILFLTILGAFYQETTSDFSCFMDKVADALIQRSTESCSDLYNFQLFVLENAKLCSVEIDKEDAAMLVRRECLERPEYDIEDTECIIKMLITSPCEPKLDMSLPFKISCLRALWKSYDCYVKDAKAECGERASKSIRFTTQSFHLILRNVCKKTIKNYQNFGEIFVFLSTAGKYEL